MEMLIDLYWTHIDTLEGCCKNTAKNRLKLYKYEYDKEATHVLTPIEYAALKNIRPEEVFIRLKIDYTKFNMNDIEALWLLYKKQLQDKRQKKSKFDAGYKTKTKSSLLKRKKMKINFLLLLFLCAFVMQMNAQDVIIKKNGEEINSKVLEISSSEIKYKRADYMDGPTYTIFRTEVFMIKYANGKKEMISNADVPYSSDIKVEKKFEGFKYCISAGYGIGVGSHVWLYGYGNNGYNSDASDGPLVGPFYLKFEGRISDEWGIGINLAYLEKDWDYEYSQYYMYPYTTTYTEHYHYTSFSGLIRANWHFSESDKIDPYFGFGLGFRNGKIKYSTNYMYQVNYDYNDDDGFPLGFETTLGLRYLVSKHFGAYVEAGIAKSVVQFGLIRKF
jgi:hypothetical protein